MIYEFITENVKPGKLGEVEERFAKAYEHRKQLSTLAAFWRVDIGPLNQIIHIWPYQDMQERERIHAEIGKSADYSSQLDEFLMSRHSEIMLAAPFSPALKVARMGPYFEIRTYTMAPDALSNVLENWEHSLPTRAAISPLVGLFHSQPGGSNKLLHIWAYPSMDEREQAPTQAKASGAWPPSVLAAKEGRPSIPYLEQESKIVKPAKFSPLQ